jgi:hypothetical protein
MSKSVNKYWLMALPLVFFIHDLEEMITLEIFQPVILAKVPLKYHALVQINTPQFAAAISLLLIGICIITYLGLKCSDTPIIRGLFFWILFVLWINSLTHILQALSFGHYVPGLVTALCLVMPYSMIFFYNIHGAMKVNLKSVLVLFITALVSSPPIIFFSLQFGKMIVKSFGG